MIFAQKDFEIEDVLYKPLMAHLSTVEDEAPRDSPVWFLWEDSFLWIFGTSKDSFCRLPNQNALPGSWNMTWKKEFSNM